MLAQRRKEVVPHQGVPLHSQFDVEEELQGKAGPPTALKMIVDFLLPSSARRPTVQELIEIGCRSEINAYEPSTGWNPRGLARMARQCNLTAIVQNWSDFPSENAMIKLRLAISKSPCMAMLKTDEGNRLIVITGITTESIHYNDPQGRTPEEIRKSVPREEFITKWKQEVIVLLRR